MRLRWERGERSREEETGKSSETSAPVRVHTHKTGNLLGKEEDETVRFVIERDGEKIPIRREVLPLEGKEGSWRTAMIRMGKFITQEGEERRDERSSSFLGCVFYTLFFSSRVTGQW